MPSYLTASHLYIAIWPLIVFSLLNAFAFRLLPQGVRSTDTSIDASLVIFAFSLVGVVAGFMSGLSRESVLDGVLPAVLSVVGFIACYAISADKLPRRLAMAIVIVFTLGILTGALWGAHERVRNFQGSAMSPSRSSAITPRSSANDQIMELIAPSSSRAQMFPNWVCPKCRECPPPTKCQSEPKPDPLLPELNRR